MIRKKSIFSYHFWVFGSKGRKRSALFGGLIFLQYNYIMTLPLPAENIKKYHPLGQKTLFMMILRRSYIFLLLLPVLIVLLIALVYVPSNLITMVSNGIIVYLGALLLVFAIVLFLGWLEYIRYWIFVDDKDLKIARGLIATEQIGVPYRHIQDIKIKRSLLDQIIGVSDIVITVLGSEKMNLLRKMILLFCLRFQKKLLWKSKTLFLKRPK